MKIIKSKSFDKLAACWDDQPNFVNRDNIGEGTEIYLGNEVPESEDEIIKKWKNRRKITDFVQEKMPERSI